MNPKFYLVGGAVRDHLLRRESADRDYVVVGASPEWMVKHGYHQVGASFPVFLDPYGNEYALARQERKVGPGYHGFETTYDSNVTLEEDLKRRDLTINSMAMDDDGTIIDPYGGKKDLEDRILRHTSEAFADDPLRVMRLARFAARYGFEVHPETMELAKKIVVSGELDHLPKERVWAELHKGLSEPNPAKMMRILGEVGAIENNLEEYFQYSYVFIDWLETIFDAMSASGVDLSIESKFLMCFEDIHRSVNIDTAVQRLSIPKSWYVMSKHLDAMDEYLMTDELISSIDALTLLDVTKYNALVQSPEHSAIISVLHINDSFTKYKTSFRDNFERLRTAYYAVKSVDLKKSVASSGDKSTVKERIEDAKLEAIKNAYSES